MSNVYMDSMDVRNSYEPIFYDWLIIRRPARSSGPKAIHAGRALALGNSSIACCARWGNGGFHKWRYPKMDGLEWFGIENPISKWMIWGVPLF